MQQGRLLRELQAHVAAAKAGGYLALPSAAARAAAFQDAAQTLVFDVLMLKVRFVSPRVAQKPCSQSGEVLTDEGAVLCAVVCMRC